MNEYNCDETWWNVRREITCVVQCLPLYFRSGACDGPLFNLEYVNVNWIFLTTFSLWDLQCTAAGWPTSCIRKWLRSYRWQGQQSGFASLKLRQSTMRQSARKNGMGNQWKKDMIIIIILSYQSDTSLITFLSHRFLFLNDKMNRICCPC